MTSPARIAANQANAQKSTGPKTLEGKQKSAQNATKHGMRAETVVLRSESTQEYQEHVEKWMTDWQPTTETRRWLVERAAIAAWRCNRCVRVESAQFNQKMNKTLKRWDQERADRIDTLFNDFFNAPLKTLQSLQRYAEAILQLVAMCKNLDSVLASPEKWVEPKTQHQVFIRLFSLTEEVEQSDPATTARFGIDNVDRTTALGFIQYSEALLFHNCPALASTPEKMRQLTDPKSIANVMRGWLQTRIKILEATLPQVDDRSTTRLQVAEREALTVTPEVLLQQRYESHHEREVRANLALVMKLEKTGEDIVDQSTQYSIPVEVAQVLEEKPVAPNEPKPADEVKAEQPNEPKVLEHSQPVSDPKTGETEVVADALGADRRRSAA